MPNLKKKSRGRQPHTTMQTHREASDVERAQTLVSLDTYSELLRLRSNSEKIYMAFGYNFIFQLLLRSGIVGNYIIEPSDEAFYPFLLWHLLPSLILAPLLYKGFSNARIFSATQTEVSFLTQGEKIVTESSLGSCEEVQLSIDELREGIKYRFSKDELEIIREKLNKKTDGFGIFMFPISLTLLYFSRVSDLNLRNVLSYNYHVALLCCISLPCLFAALLSVLELVITPCLKQLDKNNQRAKKYLDTFTQAINFECEEHKQHDKPSLFYLSKNYLTLNEKKMLAYVLKNTLSLNVKYKVDQGFYVSYDPKSEQLSEQRVTNAAELYQQKCMLINAYNAMYKSINRDAFNTEMGFDVLAHIDCYLDNDEDTVSATFSFFLSWNIAKSEEVRTSLFTLFNQCFPGICTLEGNNEIVLFFKGEMSDSVNENLLSDLLARKSDIERLKQALQPYLFSLSSVKESHEKASITQEHFSPKGHCSVAKVRKYSTRKTSSKVKGNVPRQKIEAEEDLCTKLIRASGGALKEKDRKNLRIEGAKVFFWNKKALDKVKNSAFQGAKKQFGTLFREGHILSGNSKDKQGIKVYGHGENMQARLKRTGRSAAAGVRPWAHVIKTTSVDGKEYRVLSFDNVVKK